MRSEDCLSGEQIITILQEELTHSGGTIREAVDLGPQIFARGVLPQLTDIESGDTVKGGVAVRATRGEIFVHPYTFRLICSNGAVRAHAIQTRHIVEAEYFDITQSELALREAIQLCSAPAIFVQSAAEMRDANVEQIDMLMVLAPMMRNVRSETSRHLLSQLNERIGQRYVTRYELMNHITAAARETRDPVAKWELEALGAAVAAGLIRVPRRESVVRLREPVGV